MAGYRLCGAKYAQTPYYIENISTSIYSIEELCYYFYNNIPLLDSTIIGTELTKWIASELNLPKLAENMNIALERRKSISGFVTPVFRECGYLSSSQLDGYTARLSDYLQLPGPLRLKDKGDALTRTGKYSAAEAAYRQVIEDGKTAAFRPEFLSAVYHNLGVVLMRMLLFEEGLRAFEEAWKLRQSQKHVLAYVRAIAITKPEEKALMELRLKGLSEEEARSVYAEAETTINFARSAANPVIPDDIDTYVRHLMEDYHNSVGG
ncbi:MAG: hypothetical protein IJH11_09460 [Lachnospiraceae bacterium]|jgi:tetratricopeptide (TPR) repeat protein|nr:hypothetical protein [Lachnospiraceae bacterium]